MIKGLTYTIVTTDDVPRARAFYTNQLGLSTEDDMGDTFSQFTTRDGSLWAIMQAPLAEMTSGGIMLYLRVENVDEAYRTWKARGVEMLTEPHDEPFGRTFALRDPDGHVLHAYTRAE